MMKIVLLLLGAAIFLPIQVYEQFDTLHGELQKKIQGLATRVKQKGFKALSVFYFSFSIVSSCIFFLIASFYDSKKRIN